MERVSSTVTIGIRELFRIIIPGLVIAAFFRLELPWLLSNNGNELSIGYLLTIEFFIGLVTYIAQLYRYIPPWRGVYRKQLDRLSAEVGAALNGSNPVLDKDYRAEYKYFLELKTDHSFVERVHYFTSFYYLLVQISQLLSLFAAVEFYLVFGRGFVYVLRVVLYGFASFLFYKFSRRQFETIIDEQIMNVKLNRDQFKHIQKELESQNIVKVLLDTCASLLKEIVLDPDKRDYKINCRTLSSVDWRSGLDITTYVIEVHTPHPVAVSGEPGKYKGFYKERIESVLNHILASHQTTDSLKKAVFKVIPDKVSDDSLESLVPISKAYNNIVTDASPVLKMARKYDMRYILVRGRHLVGPNPGLTQLVDEIARKNPLESALDLFSGTGIVAIVLKQLNVSSITCVDNGAHFSTIKTALLNLGITKCVSADAFSVPIDRHYDIIIADPYYQDAFSFLQKRIQEVYQNTNIFIFVCCEAEDEHLRAECKKIVSSFFGESPEERLLYGQSILVCKKS